jgi:hypothetical protein
LRVLVAAALETCCRVSELLTLQWKHVRFDLKKSACDRRTPKRVGCGSCRHRSGSGLSWTCVDTTRPVSCGVQTRSCSANAVGECIQSVDTAWTAACRRAEIVGLNFHDLRREAGSRLLEGGMPEHYAQRFLDHANLSTTSRYLKTTRRGMHEALARVEARRNRCTAVAQTADFALPLFENPTGQEFTEVPASERLTGHSLPQ